MIIGNTKKKKKDGDIAPIFSQETKQAIKNTFSSPESELAKAKIKLTWKDGYQVGDVTKTILNVRDMISPVAKAKRKGAEIGNKIVDTIQSGDFIKSSKTKQENKKIWDDGYQFGDITKTGLNVGKTVLGTTGDVAVNLVKGELQTAEGLVDTGRYIVSDITRTINPSKSFMARAHAIQNTTGVILGENDMYNRPKENGWAKKIDEYSIAGNSLDNIVQSVGQQAFRVGLQGAMGSAGASEGTQAAVNKLEIFAGSYGSAKSQALMNGADDKTATLKGFIGGTSEYISENLFDSIPGFKTGELKGVTKVKDIIGKSTEKAFGKTAGKAVVRIFSALGEGAEERLSNGLETALTDIVNCLDKNYTYGMEAGQGLTESTFGKNALKLFKDTYKSAFSKESDEAFVSAFFSTLITGAVADTMTNVERNQVIKAYAKDNNITTEQATKLFDSIRDLRLQQIVDNNTDYEQRRNIEDNLTKQISQEIKANKNLNLQELQEGLIARDKFTKAVGTGVVSSRGLDLLESYKAYNGDSKYTNEMTNLQKVLNNRGIDGRWDATYFDNNEQNALYITENGQDSVIFNPNASADQVIQNVAIHEMTHDIINQKTETGTSLFNDVLENIKTQKDYAKNRQEIEDLYAKYYDRNSKDFAAKVDEEMVANELGKNLGTQEYINRLVNEKPNLAKRLYNWVKDKLDNIGKSEDYIEQKKYWKSVADKFEKAYNEQKVQTENKTAYSVNKNLSQKYNISKELEQDFNKYIMPDIEETYKYENKETIKESLEELQQQRELYKDDNSDENWSKIFDINAKIRALENGYNTLYDYYVGQEIERQLQRYNDYPDAVNEKINKAKETEQKTNKLQKEIDEATPFKKAQYELTQKTNPMFDEYHVGIRSPKDILTWSEAIQKASEDGDGYAWGDFNEQDAKKALKDNKITIYSSYPIKNGVFVSTSYVQAQQYAGGEGNRVYSKTITPQRVAWISVDEGQYASVDVKPDTRYSTQQEQAPFTKGTRTTIGELFNEIAPIKEDISKISEQMHSLSNQLETMQENFNINANSSNTVDEVQKILGLPDSKKEKLQEIIDRAVTNDYNVEEIANKIDNETTLFYDEINDADYNTTEEQIDRAAEYIRGIIDNNQEATQQIAPVKRDAYVEPFREQIYENESYTPLTEEEADLYQNALLNDEAYRKSLDEQADFEESNAKLINKLTKDVQDRLWLDKNQRNTLENIIKDAVDNELTTDEIAQRLSMEFSSQESRYANQDVKDAKKIIKRMALKVSDGIKKDITDYGDFQRRNFNKITFSRNGMPVDVAYQQLHELLPAYFSEDIINPTEQLLRISDVANMSNEIVEKYDLPQDMFDDIADYIKESILDDEYNSQMEREASLDTDIRMNFTEDIAPTTIRTQESIDDFIENRDIAPIREDAPKQRNKSELRDRFDNMRRKFSEMVTNRNFVIDETARATGNNEIKYAGDNLNNVSGETQYNIHNKQTDINGKWVGKGLDELFAPAREAGLADVYNDYLFHKSNIERHNVGKGSEVPSIVSQQLVAKYDTEYPQLKTWAKELYKFKDNSLQEQVDSGLITQEKYNDYRGEHGIYRSHVPFYAAKIDRNRYFDDEGNLRPVSTLKRSKGGAGDVNTMLSMEEAIAKEVYASKRAIRQNELYKEIVSSLEKYEDFMDQDVRDNPTNLDDSLYITPDGDYVLSAYFDGEKVSAKISEELYNELAGTNESRIRQIEEDFSLITNPLQKVSNVRRNLLTTWNPTFLARNAIKDIQDAVINSKYTGDMLANYFGTKKGSKSAIMELRDAKTETAQQFLALYGADNLYGDYSNVGKSNKLVNKFSRINELIELAPRYAEFKATLENGGTINEAIYNAREVTTNFGRGGYITKALNRNGFTFLNANVQGLNKLIRNLSGENGAKGVTSVVAKGVAFALLPSILNHLLYGTGDDKDEEYDALPDYIKDNYYLIKLESGKFLRIPKGRINAVFGSAARRSIEALEGESDAFKGYGSNAWSQIGVGDLGSNNIFTPLTQAFGSKNGTAWYGGDIVPTRLQNVPAGEQTDASIDAVSNIIGKTFGISPYKINYVLDQYSGGLGDVLLPMMTEETTSGAENPLEYLTAPIKDSFIVNSTDDNKYAGDFYDTKDKLQVKSNSQYATDEDKLRYKYMSSVSSQMSDLYKERREVQADTTLGNKEKYAKVQAIQNEINSLAKEALNNYNNFATTDTYTNIGDVEYYKDAKGEWTKVKDDESEFTAGLNASEKTAYYNTKNKISGITQEYNDKTKDLDKDSPLKQQYSTERKENITRAITNSGLDNYSKAMLYSKYYSDKETMTNVVNAGYNVDTYITALSDIEALRTKYSQKNGYSTEQRKAKTLAYINSLDMNIPQKAMLTRQYYSSFRAYNKDIVNYVNNLDITQDEKVSILKDMGMTVNGNKVSWK